MKKRITMALILGGILIPTVLYLLLIFLDEFVGGCGSNDPGLCFLLGFLWLISLYVIAPMFILAGLIRVLLFGWK